VDEGQPRRRGASPFPVTIRDPLGGSVFPVGDSNEGWNERPLAADERDDGRVLAAGTDAQEAG
jgi:hypothetical protein